MASGDSVCESDELYVGLTRPPMFYGITDAYLIFMVFAITLIFLGLGGLRGILYGAASAPALYVFGYVMCEREPRVFQLWQVKLAYFSRARRRSAWWGGGSFDPGWITPSGRVTKRSLPRTN